MASAKCVYKDVMTAQEISACRDATAAPAENRRPAAGAPKSAAYREVELQMARDNEARRAKAEKANRPRLPVVGMSETEARQLPYPWGNPSMINKSTNGDGAHEQWVFPGRKYLYSRTAC
jgi:hypothetical protein